MAERQRRTPDDPSGPVVLRPLVDFLHTRSGRRRRPRRRHGGRAGLGQLAVEGLATSTLWHTHLAITVGRHSLDLDLQEWVNDGLMAVFFFVVGLEIKRELVEGELRDPRRAALPAIAAVGGMVVPALIYVAINAGGDGAAGLGHPDGHRHRHGRRRR